VDVLLATAFGLSLSGKEVAALEAEHAQVAAHNAAVVKGAEGPLIETAGKAAGKGLKAHIAEAMAAAGGGGRPAGGGGRPAGRR
jgi:hypothetical protein